jgi:hypothetical protein
MDFLIGKVYISSILILTKINMFAKQTRLKKAKKALKSGQKALRKALKR